MSDAPPLEAPSAPPPSAPSLPNPSLPSPSLPSPPGATTLSPITCRAKAAALVHKYTVAGAAWSVLPLPVPTSPGLVALEAHMIYWIARVYGDAPSHTDTLMLAAGLEVGSTGLKTLAKHLVGYVPVIGWGIKGVIAASTIEAMGQAIIRHFEGKYPGKLVA
jgi:uncharacterized protein (DUF697 family)